MVIMNFNPSGNVYQQRIYTHVPQMNTLVTLNYPYEQSRSALYVDATPCHTKIHKVNDRIASPRKGNLPEHVTTKNGLSSDISPSEIILGSPNPDHKILRINYGA